MLDSVREGLTRIGLLQVALLALLVAAAFVSPAAATTIDFSGSGGPGTVSWAGGTSPLVGSNITILNVALDSGVANAVIGGVLNFTTGAFTGLDPSGFYNFAPTGNLTLVGTVPAAGILSSVPLISAVGDVGAQFYPSFGPGIAKFSLTIPFGSDTKDSTLLNFFGLAPSTSFTFSGTLTGPSVTVGPLGVTASVVSADILNTAVPEPSSLLLLGSGLLGLAVWGRKRRNRTSNVGI